MHDDALRRILDTVPEAAVVLDVGGWAAPFPRADWMLDLGDYETRGSHGYQGDPAGERFSADTWVRRDICDREQWPFADDQFDFAICSHTLEDVRDPVWVCGELSRVARAGYVEVPSRLEEQSWGVNGPWAGWSHHRWLVDVDQAGQHIDFVFKPHVVHRAPNHFEAGFHATLSSAERVATLWWEGSFSARERYFADSHSLDAHLSDFVLAHGPPAVSRLARLRARRRRAS